MHSKNLRTLLVKRKGGELCHMDANYHQYGLPQLLTKPFTSAVRNYVSSLFPMNYMKTNSTTLSNYTLEVFCGQRTKVSNLL